jgi:excisionase family DNA binding protein
MKENEMAKKDLPEQPDFLTVPQAAKYCGVSRNTVFAWVKQGRLEAYQTPGRTNLIRPSHLVNFMEDNAMFVPTGLQELARKDERLGSSPTQPGPDTAGKPAILVVDDESRIRHLFVETMQKKYTLYQAATGYEALHMVTVQPHIGLLLLDIRMPGQAGTETIQELERLRPDIAVVIITGYVDDIPESVKGSPVVRQVLEKPVEMAALRDAVDAVMANT